VGSGGGCEKIVGGSASRSKAEGENENTGAFVSEPNSPDFVIPNNSVLLLFSDIL
jgi:hypothetical protein